MTYVTHSGRAAIWQRLSDLHALWAERREQHRAYRKTVAELNSLSTRDLHDLGIDRADIDRIAQEAAYGA